MLEGLTRRRAEAERRYEEADGGIPAALLDGDEGRARELRRARRDAAEEADDLGEALTLAERKEQERREAERARKLRKARSEARASAARFLEAGKAVDAALAELERAVSAQREEARGLAAALAAAGLSDGGRAERGLEPALRWAAWAAAPSAARLAGVPWAPVARRRSMAEGAARLVPRITDEE